MEKKDETKAPSNYEAFMNAMGQIYDVAALQDQRKDDRVDKKEAAKAGLRKYAYESLPKELRPAKAEDLIEEHIPNYIESGLARAGEESASILSGNLESIVNGMPEDSSKKLSQRKEIIERASQEEKEVFDAYNQWKAYEDFEKRYVDGKQLSEDEAKVVHKLAGDGLADEVVKKFSKYSTDVQENLKNLAKHAVDVGYVKADKNYVLPGLKLAIEGQKENYEKISKEEGNVEDMSRAILKRLASGNRKEFDLARRLMYESK